MLSAELLNVLPVMAGSAAGGRELTRILNGVDGKNTIRLFDDFLGDTLDVLHTGTAGSDPQAVAPAIVAGAVGGVVQLVSGDVGGGAVAVDGCVLAGALNWLASNGNLVFEARIKIPTITSVVVNVGLTDTAALENPFEIGASDALTSNATDAACLVFDTGATNDNWFCCGVKADVDAAKVNTGIAPVAGAWQAVRIEIDKAGTATFYLDGRLVASMANALTTSVALSYVFAVMSRTTATRSLQADLMDLSMDRV